MVIAWNASINGVVLKLVLLIDGVVEVSPAHGVGGQAEGLLEQLVSQTGVHRARGSGLILLLATVGSVQGCVQGAVVGVYLVAFPDLGARLGPFVQVD